VFELQPFILHWTIAHNLFGTAPPPTEIANSSSDHAVAAVSPYLPPVLGMVGAIVAFFSRYFEQIIAAAARETTWRAWVGKIAAKAALWFPAIVVPLFLWYLYLRLSYLGLFNSHCLSFAPDWLYSLASSLHVTLATALALSVLVVALIVALPINPNATSLHRLYRDRLSKAFLFRPDEDKRDLRDDLYSFEPKLHEIDTDLCPYPIINAALNIQGSRYANKRGRNADFFYFTPDYTGSEATGYVGTAHLEDVDPALDLGTAMAISGAAVSSNMGAQTVRPLAFTLAALNLRLGFWLRNPKFAVFSSRWRKELAKWEPLLPSWLLLKEMFSWITEKSPTIYLTDGGHVENLGIYALLKRRCEVIIAIDGEADRRMRFPALLTLERYARIDLGATMRLPWEKIRDHAHAIDRAFEAAEKDGSPIPCEIGPHCAATEIKYGLDDSTTAVLVYVKASVSGDEDDYIIDYKRRHPAFPHETTNDQFFKEEQLEVYRALGFHIMKGLLTGMESFAVIPGEKETEERARQRILDKVRGALLGAPPLEDARATNAKPAR